MSRTLATRYLSPLRYPGGKGGIAPFVGELISRQRPRASRYVEPFAGGAGIGLRLLHDEFVDEIVLNDLDAGVAAFWRSVFYQPDELLGRVSASVPSVDEWHRQSAIYEAKASDDVELGFATFFLNRTNRSGILNARPIGGLDQSGKWGIAARWDGDRLSERIRRLASYESRVTICSEDGIVLAERYLDDTDSFIYLDPPYLQQGEDLYLDTLGPDDHQHLADVLRRPSNWFLTYDRDPRVLELYAGLRCAVFGIAHTAAVQHIGTEYAVFADGLVLPPLALLGRGDAEFVTVG